MASSKTKKDIDVSTLIGKPRKFVQDFFTKRGLKSRLVEEDGKTFTITMDFRSDRFNLKVKDGKVTEIYIG